MSAAPPRPTPSCCTPASVQAEASGRGCPRARGWRGPTEQASGFFSFLLVFIWLIYLPGYVIHSCGSESKKVQTGPVPGSSRPCRAASPPQAAAEDSAASEGEARRLCRLCGLCGLWGGVCQ